jgi:CBS domain-containing protein
VALYVVARSLGKYAGTWVGARLSKSPKILQEYLGLGLFAQGGVAVGLSMMASQHLAEVMVTEGLSLGAVVVSTVTATTLIVQVIGPTAVRSAIRRTGELGRNVTEEDIIQELTVTDVINRDPVVIQVGTLLSDVFDTIAQHDQLAFPVVTPDGACEGVISLESLKTLFVEQELWSWMIAGDVMVPVTDVLRLDTPLAESFITMEQLEAEETIVRDPETLHPVGIFGVRSARRQVTTRLVERQGL